MQLSHVHVLSFVCSVCQVLCYYLLVTFFVLLRFNVPFPIPQIKVWPHSEYPLIPVGKLVLNRNPKNYFAEVEQLAFCPAHLVPGVEPSPDKMLQVCCYMSPRSIAQPWYTSVLVLAPMIRIRGLPSLDI